MEKLKDDGWFERLMKFDWKGIKWDNESKVHMPTFKEQRGKAVIR